MKVRPIVELTHLQLKPAVLRNLGLEPGALSLRRAWPEKDETLALEYHTEGGAIVAARRFGRFESEGPGIQRIVDELRLRGAGAVDVDPEHGLLLQAGGADRRLVPLARLVAEGATLLAHRAERRAVVRVRASQGPQYAKVVPRSRVTNLLRGAVAAERAPIRTPRMLLAVHQSGLTFWSALPGLPIEELIADSPTDLGQRVGEMVRVLHRLPTPLDLPLHGFEEEAVVVEKWLQRLEVFSDPSVLRDSMVELANRLAGPTADLAVIHRDLHDGQIVIDDRGSVGLLDFDTLSLGEAALDLANLLVHLELGVLLGSWSAPVAHQFALGVLDGYQPTDELLSRLVPYAAATRIRLACVYAFRPGPDPTEGLLDRMWEPPPSAGRTWSGSGETPRSNEARDDHARHRKSERSRMAGRR